MDANGMNETDVREHIVRPFIESLGYKYGTDAHIRTEVTLRYSKAYLGRKNPSKDPDLTGRADYVCEVIPHGRWVVEVKAANIPLSIDHSEQAHTYATHPEIAAYFYLITNGKEWRLYRIGQPQQPLLTWDNEQTDNIRTSVENILGPDAFIRRAKINEIDTGKPLAKGLGSTAVINGGYVTYAESTTSNPLLNSGLQKINGSRAPVVEGYVRRTENGEIEAGIAMLGTYSSSDQLRKAANNELLVFITKSPEVSSDPEKPTIFTNLVSMNFARGASLPSMFGNPSTILPAAINMAAFTHAVGYVENGRFKGTFEVSMLSEIERGHQTSLIGNIFFNLLHGVSLTSVGEFDLSLS